MIHGNTPATRNPKPPQIEKLQNEPNPKNEHLAAIAQSTRCSDLTTWHRPESLCHNENSNALQCPPIQLQLGKDSSAWSVSWRGCVRPMAALGIASRASTPSSLISSKKLMKFWRPSIIAIGRGLRTNSVTSCCRLF